MKTIKSVYKIGNGPSSSHTVGPYHAAQIFGARYPDADRYRVTLFGISNDIAMQLVGVGFIISVIQDSLETALNSSGDVLFTATAEFKEWKKQGRPLPL